MLNFARIIAVLSAVFFAAGLSACNTVAGAGKDIEAGGEVITDTANDVEEKL